MKTYRNPPQVSPPTGYTHQIELTGSERMLIISGQVGRKLDGTIPEDPIEQLKIALENLEHNLQAASMDFSDVVKLTYYLVGEMDTQKRREIIADKMGEHPACSTLVYVAGLASPQFKVELDAWASHTES